jgi:hypothetical protein
MGRDVASASKVLGSFFLPFCQTCLFIKCQDVLSVFDEKDPTAARPTTREKARELCSEHLTEWASSNPGDLRNLRIGIPQVCCSH